MGHPVECAIAELLCTREMQHPLPSSVVPCFAGHPRLRLRPESSAAAAPEAHDPAARARGNAHTVPLEVSECQTVNQLSKLIWEPFTKDVRTEEN